MKIKQIRTLPYRLPFTRTLRTGHGSFTHREGWIVELEDDAGNVGFGDAAPWPGLESNPQDVALSLGKIVHAHDRFADAFHLENLNLSDLTSESAYAIESAWLDLLGKRQGCPLAELLGKSASTDVQTHALVSDTQEANKAVQQGFRHLKVKVANASLTTDLERIAAIRQTTGPDVAIQLDANGGWTVREAHEAFRKMAAFDLAWIEQPLHPDELLNIAALRREHRIPVALDESIRTQDDLEKIIAHDAADIVVIKPMFAGGLRAAHRLACSAIDHGMKVIITHALESVIGRTGALHLAAALPTPQPSAGLTGWLLADHDMGDHCVDGRMPLPTLNGLGVSISPEWRAQWT